MRKWNNRIALLILILFLLHGLIGSLVLLGVSTVTFYFIPLLLFICVIIHTILSIISTVHTIKCCSKGGKWYLKENASFWAKRISGIAILFLLIFHIQAYTTSVNGVYFFKEFTLIGLISQLLFIFAIFLHLLLSLKSLLIAKGVLKWKERKIDLTLILSIFTVFFTIAIITYYINWQL